MERELARSASGALERKEKQKQKLESVLGMDTKAFLPVVPKAAADDHDDHVALKELYLAMRCMENRVGGGEGIEGIYGSITETGVSKVMASLSESCGLDASSTLLDVGAGLGRPLLHAVLSPGVASAWGIEVDPVKCHKAQVFVEKTLELVNSKRLRREGATPLLPLTSTIRLDRSSIEELESLNPATHVYTFWEGIPVQAKEALGALFSTSETCRAIAIVQRAMRNKDPANYLADLGFIDVNVVESFPVKMSGSGRSFQAYIISKNSSLPEVDLSSVAPESLDHEFKDAIRSERRAPKKSQQKLLPFRKAKKTLSSSIQKKRRKKKTSITTE